MFEYTSIDSLRFPLEILAIILIADAAFMAAMVGLDAALGRRTHRHAR